jgi:hypothetical protein
MAMNERSKAFRCIYTRGYFYFIAKDSSYKIDASYIYLEDIRLMAFIMRVNAHPKRYKVMICRQIGGGVGIIPQPGKIESWSETN